MSLCDALHLPWLVLGEWGPTQPSAARECQKGPRVHGFRGSEPWLTCECSLVPAEGWLNVSDLQAAWEAGVCVCSGGFKAISHLGAHRALILLVHWVRAGCPSSPGSPWLLSVQGDPQEGERELQHSPASLLMGLAGLSIPFVITLPCTAALVSHQLSSALQEQTKTPR